MSQRIPHKRWYGWLAAFLLAIFFFLIVPGTSLAHAELLRSDPQEDALLHVAPTQVRMWFSEAVNRSPTLSTAVVVDAANRSVDKGDAQVVSSDARELDVTLNEHLPPGIYTVAWNVASDDDGHLTAGTFHFTVTRPDGSLPPQTPPPSQQAGGSTLSTGQSDRVPLLSFLTITLLELAAVFWAGAHLFQHFVLLPIVEEHQAQEAMARQTQRRFERRLAVPTVLLLLLANSGIVLGQVVTVARGNIAQVVDPSLWMTLLTSGRFGLFWVVQELLIVLALRLAFVPLQMKHLPQRIATILSWANLVLGLALFLTMASTSHAAATSSSLVVYAVLADFLHLLAAAFWIGGIMFIGCCYLPILRTSSSTEQADSLITVLSAYSPWAMVGVVLMAITGPFTATIRLNGWDQLFTTLYGQVLLVKILLVGALLLTSVFHTFVLRPRLKRTYLAVLAPTPNAQEQGNGQESGSLPIAAHVKYGEEQVVRQVRWLRRILRWETGAGIAVLICVGLMNVFAGTLAPTQPGTSPATSTDGRVVSTHVSVVNVIRKVEHPHLFTLASASVGLMQPTVDTQGNIWVGEMTANRLARFQTRTGVVTTWEPPAAQNGIMTTAVDTHGRVWFVDQGANYIGRFDPTEHTFRIFPLGIMQGHPMGPQALAFDATGALWFTAPVGGRIGRLDPKTGTITSWSVPSPGVGVSATPFSLTITDDGGIWFGLLAGGAIGHLDPLSGHSTLFHLADAQAHVFSMAHDAKGRIWFTELEAGKLGMMDATTHTLTEWSLPATAGNPAILYSIAVAKNGEVWCANNTANALVRYAPMTGVFTFFQFSSVSSAPYGLTLDATGVVWFTAAGSSTIGRMAP